MRVFYFNLHCNSLVVQTMSALLAGKKVPLRHRCLIDELLRRNVEVLNIVTDCTLPDKGFLGTIKQNKDYKFKEAKYVLKKNGLRNVKSLTELPLIKCDDIAIFYSHFGCFNDYWNNSWIRVVDFTHFYGYKIEGQFLSKMQPEAFFCEVDLRKYSGLYKKYYSSLKTTFFSRPFSFEERFKNIIPFEKRKNKVCAMGNIARLHPDYYKHRDYIRYYHSMFMQPLRKAFYDNKDSLKDYVDCYSTIGVDTLNTVKASEADYGLVKEIKWWWNYITVQKFPKYYTSFDMVETYNKYKIVVNEMDSNCIYAIGAIEAMACGCALIAKRSEVYEVLGFKDCVSYIGYDGSLEDFKRKVEFYFMAENQGKLKRIADEGYRIVTERYTDEKVAQSYYSCLLEMSHRMRKI